MSDLKNDLGIKKAVELINDNKKYSKILQK